MPWHVEKGGGTCPAGQWAVIKDADGTTEGCHDTEADANAQLAALYANEPTATRATDRPAVRTVANVELVEVGTWPAMTGPVTWSVDDLQAAVAAFDDPGYNKPVVKLGHTDPRFDGQPAIGRVVNPRLSDDKMTLIGDLAGVPTWLADLIDGERDGDGANAFPRRSVEGTFNMQTSTGTRHRFALTAVSLLGVAFPAVSTLADIASLYGLDPEEVAASATPVEALVMTATPYHGVGTSDAGWDGGAATANCPTTQAALSSLMAWRDPDGDPTAKGSYKFPHHEVSADGAVGAANMAACSLVIGALNGGRGGTTIPADDRQAVYNHVAHHLRDGDREPPELQAAVAAQVSLEQVRQSFYSSPLVQQMGAFAWVREVYNDAVIVDDDSGSLFRVPWSEGDGGTVAWGDPEKVTVEYVAAPAAKPVAASTGALRSHLARLAADATKSSPNNSANSITWTVPSSTVSTGTGSPAAAPTAHDERSADMLEFTDEQARALRTRLGLAEDATDDEVHAAIANPPEPDRSDVAAGRGRPRLPEGAVVVDASSYQEMQRQAAQGEAAAQRLARDDRDRAIQAAIDDGKIPPARRQHWTTAWDKDPDGSREALAAMPKNLIPVRPEGYTGDPEDRDLDAEFAHLFPPTLEG